MKPLSNCHVTLHHLPPISTSFRVIFLKTCNETFSSSAVFRETFALTGCFFDFLGYTFEKKNKTCASFFYIFNNSGVEKWGTRAERTDEEVQPFVYISLDICDQGQTAHQLSLSALAWSQDRSG